MILLSLNIRGVGGPLKVASMRRLLSKTSPDILFLQETLVSEEKARLFVNSFRPDWMVCVVNALGKSGGLLVAWDPKVFILTPFLSCGGILLTCFCVSDKRRINFLNVYGLCTERKRFWEKVEGKGLLAKGDLIIAGDLNFTSSVVEVWGATALLDPLAAFFKEIFLRNQLIDILPAEVAPTWRNGRCGADEILKRLDKVLVSEDLLLSFDHFRTWVEYPYISDHAPVLLQLGSGFPTVAHPFKFNLDWLRDDRFVTMVKEVWGSLQANREEGAQKFI
jgi:endonuclease/exonuclease/phosphatase family metal-dependent hydrolase